MNSTLEKEQIISRARDAAARLGTTPWAAMDILALDTEPVTDKSQIEQLEMIIALGGAELVGESNNQHSFCSVYRIGDREYSFSSFEYGEVIVGERIIITREDFES